ASSTCPRAPDAPATAPGRQGGPARGATPARTGRRRTGTRGSCGRSWSRHLQELERSIGHQAPRGQSAEEIGEPGEVTGGQRIIEAGEVGAAIGDAEAGGGRRGRRTEVWG